MNETTYRFGMPIARTKMHDTRVLPKLLWREWRRLYL